MTTLTTVWVMVARPYSTGISAVTPRYISRRALLCLRFPNRVLSYLRSRSKRMVQVCGDDIHSISPMHGEVTLPGRQLLLSLITFHRNGCMKDRRSLLSQMGLKALFARQRKLQEIRMSSYVLQVSCSSASTQG